MSSPTPVTELLLLQWCHNSPPGWWQCLGFRNVRLWKIMCLRVDNMVQSVVSQETVSGTGWLNRAAFPRSLLSSYVNEVIDGYVTLGFCPFGQSQARGIPCSQVYRAADIAGQGCEPSAQLWQLSQAHPHPVTVRCTMDKCVLIPHPPPELTEPLAECPDPMSPPLKPSDLQLWAQTEAQRWWEVWAA